MNIAEILKDAPKETKLYSAVCGEVTFSRINKNIAHCIVVEDCYGSEIFFDEMGRYDNSYEDAECLLFPSKENRDWSTFKVEPEYPTTYEDCCDTLNPSSKQWRHKFLLATTDGYGNVVDCSYKSPYFSKLNALHKLLICRDAWWKVDNNWKPNWADSDTDKWVIECYYEDIRVDAYTNTNFILTFRTEEICNKFLETFRDLIEDCKELI